MPAVGSLEEFGRAVAGFELDDLALVVEAMALAAARRSLERSGLLLLGEVHGVRENPLIIRALLQMLGIGALALEWHQDLEPVTRDFLATGTLADHRQLWVGDGRITAGHFAMLRERAAAGRLDLVLFDETMEAGWDWSRQDEAMAARVLAAGRPAAGMLAVAGNAHTPTGSTALGTPMGAWLARQRPGVREIRIRYGSGSYYNGRPARFSGRTRAGQRQTRLHEHNAALVLDLPAATEALVPHRPGLRPGAP